LQLDIALYYSQKNREENPLSSQSRRGLSLRQASELHFSENLQRTEPNEEEQITDQVGAPGNLYVEVDAGPTTLPYGSAKIPGSGTTLIAFTGSPSRRDAALEDYSSL
jgi:hypothetical protein